MPSPSGSASSPRRQSGASAVGQPSSVWKSPKTLSRSWFTLSATQRVLWSYQNVTARLATTSGMLGVDRAQPVVVVHVPLSAALYSYDPPQNERACPQVAVSVVGRIVFRTGFQSPGQPSGIWSVPAMVTISGGSMFSGSSRWARADECTARSSSKSGMSRARALRRGREVSLAFMTTPYIIYCLIP
jgi:hypothetical protein